MTKQTLANEKPTFTLNKTPALPKEDIQGTEKHTVTKTVSDVVLKVDNINLTQKDTNDG